MDNTIEKIMMKKSYYSKEEKRDFPFVYLVIALPIIHFLVFWVYVNASSIVLAFQDNQGAFTFQNFRKVYDAFTTADEYGFNVWDSMGRSMLIWWSSLLICFPSSVITTYVLTCRIRFHYFYRVCYIMPGLIGSIIWAAIVRQFFSYDGPIIELMKNMGISLPEEAVRNGLLGARETAFPSLLIMTIILDLIGNSPILTGAFSGVSDEIMESADLDGAGFWTKCFMIAIPCIWPTITTMLVFKLTGMFTSDIGIFLYTNGQGNNDTSTIGFQLYYMTYTISTQGADRQSYGYPAAFGFFLTLITLPVCLIGRHYLEKLCDKLMG